MDRPSPKILAVDDSPPILNLIDLSLKNEYQIFLADTGKKAIECLEKHDFDLILLDVFLPDTDGFKLCADIKARPGTADTPIIFLTAATSMNEKELGFQLGADDYMTKPFNPLELRSRVKARLKHLLKKRAV